MLVNLVDLMPTHVLLWTFHPSQLSHRHTCMTSCFSSLCLKQHRVLVYEGKDKVIKIEDLRPGISYCIVARTSVLVLGRSSAYSNRQCTVLLWPGGRCRRPEPEKMKQADTHPLPKRRRWHMAGTLLSQRASFARVLASSWLVSLQTRMISPKRLEERWG